MFIFPAGPLLALLLIGVCGAVIFLTHSRFEGSADSVRVVAFFAVSAFAMLTAYWAFTAQEGWNGWQRLGYLIPIVAVMYGALKIGKSIVENYLYGVGFLFFFGIAFLVLFADLLGVK